MNNYYKKFEKPKNRKISGFSSKGKNNLGRNIVSVLSCCIVVCAILVYSGVIETEKIAIKINGFADSVNDKYVAAVSSVKSTLGVEGDVDIALPVSSGVVVEEYGVVVNSEGEENYHNGVDIEVPAGSSIMVAADGEVTAVDQRDDGTYWVTVKHNEDWSTVYGRLGEVSVAVGDQLKQGDVLGTPNSNILHFEVLEKETQKDPVNYF